MYSAANRYQQALADQAGNDGEIDVRCLSWSMWNDTGISSGYEHKALTRLRGIKIFDPTQGNLILDELLAGGPENCIRGITQ